MSQALTVKTSQGMAENVARFSFKMLQRTVAAAPAGKDVIISPLSVMLPLLLLAWAARGKTREQIFELLGLTSQEDSVSYASWLLSQLREAVGQDSGGWTGEGLDQSLILNVANGLWVRQGCEINPEFLQVARASFDAKVEVADFSQSASVVRAINAWVSEQTRGRITHIVDALDSQTVMHVLNAIFFKGKWEDPFEPSDTKDELFYLLDGTIKRHPLMYCWRDMSYTETGAYQCVALPFKSSGRTSVNYMTVLPRPEQDFDQFVATFDSGQYVRAYQALHYSDGKLWLPRIKFAGRHALESILTGMGMPDAFDLDCADFGGLYSGQPDPNFPFYISGVGQKVTALVDEKGAEFAAATGFEMALGACIDDEPPPWEMRVDRPHLIVLDVKDLVTRTRVPAFVGVVKDPEDPGPPAD